MSKDIKHQLLYVSRNLHLFIHNNWNFTGYKTVSIVAQILARIRLIASYFLCQSYFAPFKEIWNYSDNCCQGHHEKYVILVDFDEIV